MANGESRNAKLHARGKAMKLTFSIAECRVESGRESFRKGVRTMKGSMENTKICNVEDASERRNMSAHATFSCGRCGARADAAANVCDPVVISDSGTFGE